MKLTIFTLLLFSNLCYCQSFSVQNISKIICSLSRSSHTDIFNEKLGDLIKLSKNLFQQCNIRVRNAFDVRGNIKYDFILFASHHKDTKASLRPFQKSIDIRALLDITSNLEVQSIFKIWTVRKLCVFLPRCRTFKNRRRIEIN